LGVTFLPEALEHFPAGAKSVLESGIGTGSICALVLNLVVPHPKAATAESERVSMETVAVED
jgi:xanthine/uracil permease